MTDREDDHAPMLSGNIELPRFTARSASMSMPASFAIEDTFISHTGPLRIQRAPENSTVSGPLNRNRRNGVTRMQSRLNAVTPEVFGVDDSSYGRDVMRNEHLLMSGPLGLCNNPDCTECPAAYKTKQAFPRSSISQDKKVRFAICSIPLILLWLFLVAEFNMVTMILKISYLSTFLLRI